ncbi:hypothetical protein [Hyalangium versicolor]|uniref:hypothetical protein n=1 Tax=Hyalangium versicolor TaxID=2861190 RepID=UPI001CCFDCC9|nr:hypothetical protein [Hyalangium versicolor]
MKKSELKAEGKQPGRVLGRVLAEELECVRGGYPGLVVAQATGGRTRDPHGHPDLTGGSADQTDGD